jgi:copper(I)-binding protein
MLMGLEKPLVKGDEISINLIFEESGEQMIRIPVLGMGEQP